MATPPLWREGVTQAFAHEGTLWAADSSFRQRPGQQAMAQAVAQTLEEGGTLVVEAGTGVGKTYAYLVPVLLARQRVLLSTATKALQDQLYGRDLPLLSQALGIGLRVALLKGRGSYLCPHRLTLHQSAVAAAPGLHDWAAELIRWAARTTTGDLAEIRQPRQAQAVWPLITSTRDNCLGSGCPTFRRCHVQTARQEALSADVVVINHHLFFADQSVREMGMAELLPSVEAVVFDEAHRLNDIGIEFLGQQISQTQCMELARDALTIGREHAAGIADWVALSHELEQSTKALGALIGGASGLKLWWYNDVPDDVDAARWHAVCLQLEAAVAALGQALQPLVEQGPDVRRMHERLVAWQQRWQALLQPMQADAVRWVELGRTWRMARAPLDAHAALDDGARNLRDGPRSWVFTSATLGEDEDCAWFRKPLGIEQAQVLQVPSPFDYERQAAYWVPTDLPAPSDAQHSDRLAQLVAPLAQQLGGRTLLLTTSLRAMQRVAQVLRDAWAHAAEAGQTVPVVLTPTEVSRQALVEKFLAAHQGPSGGAVMVASMSFWEGVDIPGPALQMVVIDKLPFPVPDDPLVRAFGQRARAQGLSPFAEHALPAAAVALKQGAGRLIRTESDKGLLIVGDVRLQRQSYGARLRRAMPIQRQLQQPEALQAWLEELTKAATTAASDRATRR